MCNQNRPTVTSPKVDSGVQFEALEKDHWFMVKIYKQVTMSAKGRVSWREPLDLWLIKESLAFLALSIFFFFSFLSISPGNKGSLEIVF